MTGVLEYGCEDMLKPEFAEVYKAQKKSTWLRLIRIHRNLTVMDALESFPFPMFVGRSDLMFWELVNQNLGDMVIVTCYSLLDDEHSLTLLEFKNRVLNWLSQSSRTGTDSPA